jgi:hypothetical protein
MKPSLYNSLLKNPLDFNPQNFEFLIEQKPTFEELRDLTKRIFSINEKTLLKASDATTGTIGTLNKFSSKKRTKHYFELISKGHRTIEGNKVIVAEGDSWFQFPVFVSDIIDWLNKNRKYAVLSLAYGGDWLSNIIYEGKYVEELSIHRPDFFLISGSGNDLVGGNRIAIMVNRNPQTPKYLDENSLIAHHPNYKFYEHNDFKEKDAILLAQPYLTKEFYAFLSIIKLQYWLIFESISHAGNLKGMKIISQGYDYVIPSDKTHFSDFMNPLINSFMGTGKWLRQPMMIQGIADSKIQKSIMVAMIFEINQIFIELSLKFDNVYHIDCRGVAKNENDWYDEIHLTSENFKRVAQAYEKCIKEFSETKSKVLIARDLEWSK